MKKLEKFKYRIYKILTKCRILPAKVILLLDGGVCSQMHQYLLGQYYVDKGYRVRFDMSFYKDWGSDLNFQFARNFDLLKAFPSLSLQEASKTAVSVYHKKYYYYGNSSRRELTDFSFLERTPPIYLGGYYVLPAGLWLSSFHRLYRLTPGVLDEPNERLCDELRHTSNTIAVHVRRGDLKEVVFGYGQPASMEYFHKAICFFGEKLATPCFYFFSDEPDWVQREIIPHLPTSYIYKVVNINGSDKGYMDLYLMANCQHQITSKGTMGKYSALFLDNPQKYVVLCDDVTEYWWKELLHNPIFL